MKVKLTMAIATAAIAIYCIPIFEFYAHQGKLPMPPWGQIKIPSNAPKQSNCLVERYQPICQHGLALLEKHRQKIASPGITISVAIAQQPIWSAAAGWSDIQTNTAMSTESQLRIGSTSKALTSAGLARLVQQQKLSLDTPLADFYQTLPNPNWSAITPRQLASHMAGIPHYGQNTDRLGALKTLRLQSHFDNVADAVGLFDQSKLLFAPGEQFTYSSLGTVLLSAAIENAAKMPYQTWMQQQVFTPLALNATSTESVAKNKGNLATFYWRSPKEPMMVRKWRDVDLSHRLAGGGWVSTSKDLVMFGQGFLNPNYIAAAVRETFWTPQQLNNGEINPQNYAIGWRRHRLTLDDGKESVEYLNHGGVSRGAQSFLMIVPEYQLSLAVNINSKTEVFSDFAQVAGQITRLFIAHEQAVDSVGAL